MSRSAESRAFTLAELLVATGILALFGFFATLMIVQITGFIGDARSRAEAYGRALKAAEMLTLDLKQAASDSVGMVNNIPMTRFLSRPEDTGNHILAFVRCFGRGDERGRYMTDSLSGREYYDLVDDDKDGRVDANLRPTDGFAELVYFLEERTLYRAMRSPVTGSMENLRDKNRARKVADGVLRFSLRFWGPETQRWDPPKGGSIGGQERIYPLDTWDSTRGLQAVFKDFPYNTGPISIADPTDDIFPKMVEVTFVLDGGPSRRGTLIKPAGLDDGKLTLGKTDWIPGPEIFPYLLIGDEWLRYSSVSKRTVIAERGVLGSKRRPHAAGARVYWGYPIQFRVFIPAGKDAYDIGDASSYRRPAR